MSRDKQTEGATTQEQCEGCFHSQVCPGVFKSIESVRNILGGECEHFVPATDVVEVRHGHWKYLWLDAVGYICGYLSNLREIRETKKKIKLLEEFKQWRSENGKS